MKLATWYALFPVYFVFSLVYDVAKYISQFCIGIGVLKYILQHSFRYFYRIVDGYQKYKCINIRDMLY